MRAASMAGYSAERENGGGAVGVDPAGELTADQLTTAWRTLARCWPTQAGIELIDNNLAAMPPKRREVEMLMTGDRPGEAAAVAAGLCAKAFGTDPVPGVLTYVSRGTDDDAHGVLAGFGLTGDIDRVPTGDDGWDVIT